MQPTRVTVRTTPRQRQPAPPAPPAPRSSRPPRPAWTACSASRCCARRTAAWTQPVTALGASLVSVGTEKIHSRVKAGRLVTALCTHSKIIYNREYVYMPSKCMPRTRSPRRATLQMLKNSLHAFTTARYKILLHGVAVEVRRDFLYS